MLKPEQQDRRHSYYTDCQGDHNAEKVRDWVYLCVTDGGNAICIENYSVSFRRKAFPRIEG